MILPASNKFISHAINNLKNGKVIVYPTDTIYGFGVDATNTNAIKKLNYIKKRITPLSIIVSSFNDIANFGYLNSNQKEILLKYLPGPYTFLIRKKKSSLSELVTLDSAKVGVRIPDSKFCMLLTSELGPIITTSVNQHKNKSINDPVIINNTIKDINIYSSGLQLKTTSSTIIDISNDKMDIIRTGGGKI